MASIIELHPALGKILEPNVTAEKVATGFTFTEGPVWDYRRKRLVFSDIPNNTVFQWTEAEGHAVVRKPSDHTNGNTIDHQGRLISCEHAGRRVSLSDEDGSVSTLADRYEGKRLNSPNDVIYSSRGEVFFTDPPYGLRQPDGSFTEGELQFSGVYRLSENGELQLLVDDFERPNGLVMDEGEAHLFVDDTQNHHVRVFDIADDRSLTNGRVFAELKYSGVTGRPDGMKMDIQGNLYVAGNTIEGIWVFNPEGVLIGLVGVGEEPANLAWGGDGWKTLFVTARTSVYRLPMRVAGQPVGG